MVSTWKQLETMYFHKYLVVELDTFIKKYVRRGIM